MTVARLNAEMDAHEFARWIGFHQWEAYEREQAQKKG